MDMPSVVRSRSSLPAQLKKPPSQSKEAIRKRQARLQESEERRAERLASVRERQSKLRQVESDAQYADRTLKARWHNEFLRAQESDAEYAVRLAIERQRSRDRRSRESAPAYAARLAARRKMQPRIYGPLLLRDAWDEAAKLSRWEDARRYANRRARTRKLTGLAAKDGGLGSKKLLAVIMANRRARLARRARGEAIMYHGMHTCQQ